MPQKAQSQEQRRNMMLNEPVSKVIPKMAIPTIVAFLITSIYSLADTYFVSSLGTNATAAVSVNASLDQLILMFGALMAVIGNYMPKISHNRTLGIKIKWTLENEENWNATHRLAGKLWVCGGVAMLFIGFLPSTAAFAAMMAIVLVMVIVPTVYSYRYYKKHRKDE